MLHLDKHCIDKIELIVYNEQMKSFFLSSILIFGLINVLAETKENVVHYVSPTEPLSSCPGNSSCPPGQLCHTMDYLANHSSEFFSPDHVNVTLIFMCGVHNYTKDLAVQNFYLFVMKGAAESRENVIIDHQFSMEGSKPKCTLIQFFNVSFVNITTLTMRCPAIKLKESHITMKSSNLYGYPGKNETLSFINITGRGSQALLDNCTFKENCFIRSYFSDGITVSNSTFQSYRHQLHSIIAALSSEVTLAGNVYFTNSTVLIHSSSGTAVYLKGAHPELKSSLNIITGATVYFINLKCNRFGGAVYGYYSIMHIGAKARVVFMHNAVYYGGVVFMSHGMITIGNESYGAKVRAVFMNNSTNDVNDGAMAILGRMITVGAESYDIAIFAYNHATHGGAIMLDNATLIVDSEANLTILECLEELYT